MKVINDFFCGAGGFSLGFQKAGFNVQWACDIDAYCVDTYRHNLNNFVVKTDIANLNYKDIPKADGWTFGFPCQDLSIAGQHKGFILRCKVCGNKWNYNPSIKKCPKCNALNYSAASRSACFFEIMRLLDETKANSPENYPSFLLAENVKGLRPYIPALEQELDSRGFDVYIQLYNSKYFDVPQNRERYYIVAIKKGHPAFTFPEEQHEYVPKLSSALDKEVDEKYYIPDEKTETIIKEALKINNENAIYSVTGLLDPNGCGKTIRVGGGGSLTKKHNYQYILIKNNADYRIRKLTPKECGRLQGFPIDDGWLQVVSDRQAYKQFGNAVTVNVIVSIARAIKKCL